MCLSMKLNLDSRCTALINPAFSMVALPKDAYPISISILKFLSYLLGGGIITQFLVVISAYITMEDSQAANMIAQEISKQLSYYFLGCGFLIMSMSNVLIKRGVIDLRVVRILSLLLIALISGTSFLIIPRMEYLIETALLDGMPVMQSPLARYFFIVNSLAATSIIAQIYLGVLVSWRLNSECSTEI